MSTVAVSTALDREQLIFTHLPQVRLLALRQHKRCPPEVLLEDLISIGTVGLIQAVDRYDPRRKLKLKTLAEHRIRGAMLDHLRSLDSLPRSVRQFQRRREQVAVRLQERCGDTPLDAEIAAELKLPLSRYRVLDREAQAGVIVSLDHMATRDHIRTALTNEATVEQIEIGCRLDSAIRDLPEPERTVIEAVRQGWSLREVALRLGTCESRISQIKANGIGLLRNALGIVSPVSSRISA